MKNEALNSSTEYFKQYIDLVEDGDIKILLEDGGIELYLDNLDNLLQLGDMVYADNKWTVKQIVRHNIDCEIIFQGRVLRFLRNDPTELPGFDEGLFARNANVKNVSLEELLEEHQIVRMTTSQLYKNLSMEEMLRSGIANGTKMSVLAIGFVFVGHPIHHFNVIKERYFPLLS